MVRDISTSWIRGCGHGYISSYKPLLKGAGARVIVYGSNLLLIVTSTKFILAPFSVILLIGTVLSPKDLLHFGHDLCWIESSDSHGIF